MLLLNEFLLDYCKLVTGHDLLFKHDYKTITVMAGMKTELYDDFVMLKNHLNSNHNIWRRARSLQMVYSGKHVNLASM